MQTPSKREVGKASQIADSMVASFAAAGNEAFESAFSGLTAQLRNNEPLVWRLSAIMKNPVLVALLDGSLTDPQEEGVPTPPSSSKKRKMLRQAAKKFKHLTTPPNLVLTALQALAPNTFGGRLSHHDVCVFLYRGNLSP